MSEVTRILSAMQQGALRVLFYELLTGTTPLSKERLKQAAIAELLRAIREEEPPWPSFRVTPRHARASLRSRSHATRRRDLPLPDDSRATVPLPNIFTSPKHSSGPQS